MNLWPGWKSVEASGWWTLHHLHHDECGWTTHAVYNFAQDADRAQARRVMAGHERICPEPGYVDE